MSVLDTFLLRQLHWEEIEMSFHDMEIWPVSLLSPLQNHEQYFQTTLMITEAYTEVLWVTVLWASFQGWEIFFEHRTKTVYADYIHHDNSKDMKNFPHRVMSNFSFLGQLPEF